MRWKLILFFIAISALLAGCGNSVSGSSEKGSPESTESTVPMAEVTQAPARPVLDWRTDSWNMGNLSVTNHDLYLQDFMQDAVSYPLGYEIVNSSFSYQGDNIYRLDLLEQRYLSEEGDGIKREYSLSCYDGGKMEIWRKTFPVPELEEYKGLEISYAKMDMVSGEELVLFFSVYDAEGEVAAYPAVRVDLNGNRLSAADLLPGMQESGLGILPLFNYRKACADRQGYYYLLPDYALTGLEAGRILVLDGEGKPIGFIGSEESGASVDIAADSGGGAVAMKDPDGNALFRIYNYDRQELCLTGYRPETGERIYAQIQAGFNTPMALSTDGYLYYSTGAGNLYRWDLYTGDRKFCINYQSLGLEDSAGLLMGAGIDGQLYLLDSGLGIDARLYQIGPDPGKAKSAIRMVSLTGDDCRYISECALGYSTEHPDYIISLEKPGIEGLRYSAADQMNQIVDDYRTRALADLAAGKGADMYYVTAGDMEMLYEKGALADLSDVLPQEYVDAIFPGFLECGVIDGKQMGLPPEGYVTVVMADNSLWSGESWSWDEAMAVKESNPGREQMMVMLRGIMGSRTRGNNSGKEVMFRDMYLRYLTETPFLDLEAGTCDFESPRFIRLLEMLNDHPGVYNMEENALPEQWAVAFMTDVADFPTFTHIMSRYGEMYRLVGYPAENAGGNYWSCDYYLVVNKDTAYMEQIREYLISLYDYERQRNKDSYTVRNDLMRDLLKENIYVSPPALVYGWNRWYSLGLKPDGTTWDQEYLELLNTARPYRNMDTAIGDIIMEEVGAYFTGDRDVQTVAAQIQNRVQLYLDERK